MGCALVSNVSELYLQKPPLTFLGVQTSRDKTPLSFVGVPLDVTSSFRPGSRFAPYYVRLASLSLETYSLRAGIDLDEVGVHDEGDVVIAHGDVNSSLRAIEVVAEDLLRSGRLTVFAGGEHLLLYAIAKALMKIYGGKICVVIFDAHADYRSEYLGVKLSHACTVRRVCEVIPQSNVMLVGIRALSSSEVKDLKKSQIRYVTSIDIVKYGLREAYRRIKNFIEDCQYVHVSVDMDVLDPAYAPAVSTPEPEGITPTHLLDLLDMIMMSSNVVGLDTSEYVPLINGLDVTGFMNAKIIIESLTYMYRRKKQGDSKHL